MNWQEMLKPEPFTYAEWEAPGAELEEEWQGEVNRSSPDYIRWVQRSLNQIMGVRLAVDGVIGPATRSAIRSFQQKQGLATDGVVGPKTKAALMVALGILTTPPSFYPPGGQPTQQTVFGWSQYRRRVEELPPDQQAILKGIGDAIIASYQPGHQAVRAVEVHGHADQDTPRNAQREQQISQERARETVAWLWGYVGNSISEQITWFERGLGATQVKAPPTTEENRRQNRRVEILLSSETSGRVPPPALSPRELAISDKPLAYSWLKKGLAAVTHLEALLRGTPGVVPSDQAPLFERALNVHFKIPNVLAFVGQPPTLHKNRVLQLLRIIKDTYQLILNLYPNNNRLRESGVGNNPAFGYWSGAIFFTRHFKEFDPVTREGYGRPARSAMIVHEYVHVVDPESGREANHISEWDVRYDKMTAEQSIHNPSSYNAFGQHVCYGVDTRYGTKTPEVQAPLAPACR